jgi:anti-sigma-K factor RskA
VNVKEFISAGIIESYVLGLCSDAEKHEVESACEHFPEIAKAKREVEEKIEALLIQEQYAPPAALQEKILGQINNAQISTEANTEQYEETPLRRIGIWKWVAAASLILLAGSIFWIFQLKKENKELAAASDVRGANDSTQYVMTEMKAELDAMKSGIATLQSPALRMASLKGLPATPTSKASLFWDTVSKDVYLIINNLPQPASDKQYQLWALINKQPVDLGVFDPVQSRVLVKMKNVQNAQAFAITLEPTGGSAQPTMKNMYVYGKL